MYGLLIENVRALIVEKYGESTWNRARELAAIPNHSFVVHNVYSETVIHRLINACSEVTGVAYDDLMYEVGVTFVSFVTKYGYGRILKVLGRNMRDFLNGLDNLHEYFRFGYPKLRPPSFFVSSETRQGMILHYRSKRKGFLHYVLGQIREIGRIFYDVKVELEVLKQEDIGERGCVYVIKIVFDNKCYLAERRLVEQNPFATADSRVRMINDTSSNSSRTPTPAVDSDELFLPSNVFFDIFPFHVLLDQDLCIKSIGTGLKNIVIDVTGKRLIEAFDVARPNVDFSWNNILLHTNVVFELVIKPEVQHGNRFEAMDACRKEKLRLKGQMMHMGSWDCIVFLGTPILESLESLYKIGLYINDLSMHDSSRDLILAGTQQSAELRLALDQEKQKSSMLEESMRRLDVEMSRTDALLYRMIPKQVADRLRKGEPAMSTCQTFENVTILFSDIVGFTSICSKILPMEVVRMLNEMYTKFDQLSEIHEVYKVETIGDAYMVVSGVPEATVKHAQNVADMALSMIEIIPAIQNPAHDDQHLKTRIGIHSGTVVAGVVGIKMPRYCLFGDTVNTASRMESGGAAMSIHISESTRNSLPMSQYTVKKRGTIPIKGKGAMQTYWLTGKAGAREGNRASSDPLPWGTPEPDKESLSGRTSSLSKHRETKPFFYAEKVHPAQFDLGKCKIPQCPFSAIFQDLQTPDESPLDDHLLDTLPKLENSPPCKRGHGDEHCSECSNLQNPRKKDLHSNDREKPERVITEKTAPSPNLELKSSSRFEAESTGNKQQQKGTFESENVYNELLEYRNQEGSWIQNGMPRVTGTSGTHLNGSYIPVMAGDDRDVVKQQTSKSSLGSGVFQIFSYRKRSRRKQDNIDQSTTSDSGIAVIFDTTSKEVKGERSAVRDQNNHNVSPRLNSSGNGSHALHHGYNNVNKKGHSSHRDHKGTKVTNGISSLAQIASPSQSIHSGVPEQKSSNGRCCIL